MQYFHLVASADHHTHVIELIDVHVCVCVCALCRFIGWLSTRIKSRSDSEENMLKRYLRLVQHREVFPAGRATGTEQAPISARHSAVHRQHVVWPKLTKENMQSMSGLLPLQPLAVGDCFIQDRLVLILGEKLCQAAIRVARHAGFQLPTACDVDIRVIKRKISVGNFTYDFKMREDQRKSTKTCSSWFRIRTADVPQYVSDPRSDPIGNRELKDKCEVELISYSIDPFLYGRIIRFVQVTVPHWNNDEPYQLAQVELFKSHQAAKYTNLRHINAADALRYKHHCSDARLPIEFIHVKFLDSNVAVAPFGRQPPLPADCVKGQKDWKYVLPIEHYDHRDLDVIDWSLHRDDA